MTAPFTPDSSIGTWPVTPGPPTSATFPNKRYPLLTGALPPAHACAMLPSYACATPPARVPPRPRLANIPPLLPPLPGHVAECDQDRSDGLSRDVGVDVDSAVTVTFKDEPHSERRRCARPPMCRPRGRLLVAGLLIAQAMAFLALLLYLLLKRPATLTAAAPAAAPATAATSLHVTTFEADEATLKQLEAGQVFAQAVSAQSYSGDTFSSTGDVIGRRLITSRLEFETAVGGDVTLSGSIVASSISSAGVITGSSFEGDTIRVREVVADITQLGDATADTLVVRTSVTASAVNAYALGVAGPSTLSTLTADTIAVGQLSVSGGVSFSTVTAASLTASGAIAAASLTTSGDIAAASLTTPGAIVAASLTTSGAIAAASLTTSGAIVAASLTTSGDIAAASLTTSGAIAAGAIAAASLTTSGAIAAASLTTSGAITAASLTASGAIAAASLTTSGAATVGSLTVVGAFSVGSLALNSISVAGALMSGSLSTAGTIMMDAMSTAGTITTGVITTMGLVEAGTVTSFGAVRGLHYLVQIRPVGAAASIPLTPGFGMLYTRSETPAWRGSSGVETTITTSAVSDGRYKIDLEPISEALGKIETLRGYRYRWGANAGTVGKVPGDVELGLVAQEVEAIAPELVQELRGVGGVMYKVVDYQRFTAVLVEAVRELADRVAALENR